jgi:RimJ/RimL family protein N-acetyltransferase
VERGLTTRLVPFDEAWLPVTARWLSDPEIARLTDSAPFDPQVQREWFDGLPQREDYKVWGIEHGGVKVGVIGLKCIGVDDGAEYFVYLGERTCWGKGIGRAAFAEVEREARARGLSCVFGRVAKHNERSVAFHRRIGFDVVRDDGDSWWMVHRAAAQGPRRVPFEEQYLHLSYEWLNDPEMARLTMTAAVTPEAQREWWAGLPHRSDYAVWGIEYDGVPVGVMGVKHIGVNDGAEYFMYIGDRAYWGRGIAAWAFREVVAEVRSRGLSKLYGVIGKHNARSLAVHVREGFRVTGETDVEWLVSYDV